MSSASPRRRAEFYAFLVRRKIPYVFLSNTGAKGSQGTQSKLAKMGFMMQHRPVPLQNIYTAAQAQVAYMVRSAPRCNPPPPRALTPHPANPSPTLTVTLSRLALLLPIPISTITVTPNPTSRLPPPTSALAPPPGQGGAARCACLRDRWRRLVARRHRGLLLDAAAARAG